MTSATAIVTGADPELTNMLLQQLAIALYCYKNKIIIDLYDKMEQVTTSAAAVASNQASCNISTNITSSLANNASIVKPYVDIVVQEIRIEYSLDNIHWKHLGDFTTELSVPSQVVSIPLTINDSSIKDSESKGENGKYKVVGNKGIISTKKNVLLKTNYLKITPFKWLNSSSSYGPSMRVQLQRQIPLSDDEGDGSIMTSSSAIVIVPSTVLSNTLNGLVNALNVLIDVMEYLQKSDDYQYDHKQMEVKKVRLRDETVMNILIFELQ
jgi:hypothetical protein